MELRRPDSLTQMDVWDALNTAVSLLLGGLFNHLAERRNLRIKQIEEANNLIDETHELALSYWLAPQDDGAGLTGSLVQARLTDIEVLCQRIRKGDATVSRVMSFRQSLTGGSFLERNAVPRTPSDPRILQMNNARTELKASLD